MPDHRGQQGNEAETKSNGTWCAVFGLAHSSEKCHGNEPLNFPAVIEDMGIQAACGAQFAAGRKRLYRRLRWLPCVDRITAVSARTSAGAAVRSSEMRCLASRVRIFSPRGVRCKITCRRSVARALAAQELPFFQPVNELDDAVMAQLHALGELADAGLAAGGQSAQRQHQQILLRLKVRVARGFLAAVQKYADLISEFRKGAKFRGGHRACGHNHIVSPSDINASLKVRLEFSFIAFTLFEIPRRTGNHGRAQIVFSESSRIVTGPSLTSSTCMCA